jgi:hypothetical protein
MSNQSITSRRFAKDTTSEAAVRGVLRRRRSHPSPTTAATAADGAADPSAAGGRPTVAGRGAPLRRWSVAELIARAIVAPPGSRVNQG